MKNKFILFSIALMINVVSAPAFACSEGDVPPPRASQFAEEFDLWNSILILFQRPLLVLD
jgi:hypothetical protein